MQEVRAFLKLKKQDYERLLDYYLLLLDLIKAANKAGLRDEFLTQAYIEEMAQAILVSKENLWRERKAGVSPNKPCAAFSDFVDEL